MGSTRAVLWAGALALWTLLPACRQSAAEPLPEGGVLVLELGGDNPPLRESLQALGVAFEPEPAPPPRSAPVDAPASLPPQPDPEPTEPSGADPQPRSASEFFTVELEKGETLWDLARAHLGTGARWKEILELNGWTEAGARRLRAGTTVRIPRE